MPADAPFHARRPVVAQVLADAGHIMAALDAQTLAACRLADAGKLQELRRRDAAGRDDDFAGRTCLVLCAAAGVSDTGAAAAFEHETFNQRIRFDREVCSRPRRLEIAPRRAHASATADRGLRHGDAVLVAAVVVARPLDPDRFGGGEEAVIQAAPRAPSRASP